jgi:hypothetical protein
MKTTHLLGNISLGFSVTCPVFAATLSTPRGIVSSIRRNANRQLPNRRPRVYMNLEDQRPPLALFSGGALLSCFLLNRLFLTPIDAMYPPQARSDILGVIASATLLLYGLGRIELAERRAAVEVGGVDVMDGFQMNDADTASIALSNEVVWTATVLFDALPNVKSFALVLNSGKCFRVGRFRSREAIPFVAPGGIALRTLETGKRAYLADLNVVPVKEVEFGFLPENCQVRRCYQSNTKTFLFSDLPVARGTLPLPLS